MLFARNIGAGLLEDKRKLRFGPFSLIFVLSKCCSRPASFSPLRITEEGVLDDELIATFLDIDVVPEAEELDLSHEVCRGPSGPLSLAARTGPPHTSPFGANHA